MCTSRKTCRSSEPSRLPTSSSTTRISSPESGCACRPGSAPTRRNAKSWTGRALRKSAPGRQDLSAMTTAAHARRQLAFPPVVRPSLEHRLHRGQVRARYAPPLKFLLYRFVLVAALMGVVAVATDAVWPATLAEVGHVVIAAWLVHGIYLGGVLVAIASGMSAGMAAMLVGLQPIVTVILARGWLGERVVFRQWVGLALGLAGVWLVVRHKVALTGDGNALAAILLALAGISVAPSTRSATARTWTCAAARSSSSPRARSSTRRSCSHSSRSPCIGLPSSCSRLPGPSWCCRSAQSAFSIGCCGTAPRRMSPGLFFLVPAVTAVMAFVLFDETLDAIAVAGMALISVGVALARQARDPPTP